MFKRFKNLFGAKKGVKKKKRKRNKKFKKVKRQPIFSETGNITYESVSARREAFLGKSPAKIAAILKKHGYIVKRDSSNSTGSTAKIITTLNPSKERNITQTQVTRRGRRHGPISYVKISTSNLGKIKIIDARKEDYKDGLNEKAKLLFRRDINDDE